MYPLFLIVCVALVTLCPIALDRWLSFHEHRDQRDPAHEGGTEPRRESTWAFE